MLHRCTVVAALLLVMADAAAAQVVRGRLTGARSGELIVAAFVTLEREDGTRAVSTLSDDAGAYALRAAPGVYRLRVERLALRAHVTEWFSVGPDQAAVRDLTLDEHALELPALQVSAGRRGCGSTGELGAVAELLWDETRKALEVAAWTAQTQPVRVLVQRSLREWRAGGRRVTLEVEDSTLVETSGSPWRSAPAEELARSGFVRRQGEGYLYYGPDADLLLSEVFLASHCFELAEHETDSSLVGLRFRPRGTPRVTDIAGVLWLRRQSLALQSLTYTYVALPYRVQDSVGGEVRFRRLTSGAWIVDEWISRTPRPEESRLGPARAAPLLISEHRFRVAVVLDSVERSPLPTAHGVAGRAATPLDLPLPGGSMSATIWAAQRCGRTPAAERAHAVGQITTASGGAVGGAKVRLTLPRKDGTFHVYDTDTDRNGYYRLCDVPTGQPVRVEVEAKGFAGAARELPGEPGTLIRADFALRIAGGTGQQRER